MRVHKIKNNRIKLHENLFYIWELGELMGLNNELSYFKTLKRMASFNRQGIFKLIFIRNVHYILKRWH